MSNLDFQNGLIVGLATAGLVRSGQAYEPEVYMDEGDFTGFYINFRRAVSEFSYGMLIESIKLYYQNGVINIVGFTRISNGVIRINCTLPQQEYVVVENRKDGYLTFTNGSKVPPFFVEFFAGTPELMIKPAYVYEPTNFDTDTFHPSVSDVSSINLNSYLYLDQTKDSVVMDGHSFIVNDFLTIQFNPWTG